MAKIFLPQGLKEIGRYAFLGCVDLAEIHIPESVCEIGDKAFDGCEKLTVYGTANSFAQRYAEANGIAFAAE